MSAVKKELIKQFAYEVEGLDYEVQGYVYRINNEEGTHYHWDISHLYQPSETAGVYHPSVITAETAEEAERLLDAYAMSFTTIGVEAA